MAELETLTGVREVPRDEWNSLVGEESPFLEWEWLASLEDAGCVGAEQGWAPRPLVLRENGRLIAACPMYLKGNSEGEFVFDWGWADAAHRAGLEYYPKLLVGVPFTPVTGARFLVAEGEDRAQRSDELARALLGVCESNEFSGVHVNFCLDDDRSVLEKAGYLPRLGFQYHWLNQGFESFDDYLGSLRSKRRNQVRRERRELEHQGIEIERLTGEAISDDLFEPMYKIYLSTIRNNPWGRQYLNRKLFDLLRERFRHRLCFMIARRGDEILAGTMNVQKGDALYGRYWGCFEELRHLHFNVCYYAGIEHCIEHGLNRFEPGAGGQYKQLRGFDAYPTWSLHHLRDPRLAHAVGRFLEAERDEAGAAIEWYGEHSANRRGE
ncbi:MAG: GNAT family N-acetyltransferase [Deltaproteobacteria bacterium]|nr:GNAT family N-acetyltransferase [Deltaproteobacteria bacterium]MBW2393545.1 GNAT family N-acetyltransferase [Deltaproteobacteria bacterium]